MPADGPSWVLFVVVGGMQLAATAAVVAVLWAWERYRPGHDHWFVPVQVDHDRSFASAMGGGDQYTRILWRCRWCPHVRSTTVEGVFTLDDVLAWGAGPMPPDWRPRTPIAAITAGGTP